MMRSLLIRIPLRTTTVCALRRRSVASATVPNFPVGESSFREVSAEGRFFVDKTSFIPALEKTARYLQIRRPQRFGKTLVCDMLAEYYDAANKDQELIFKNTDIVKQNLVTKEMGQYLVLRMNFDEVSPEGNVRANFRDYINDVVQAFSNKYYEAKLLNRRVKVDPTSEWSSLLRLFSEVQLSGREIYLIIDECDAFVNKLLFRIDTSQPDLGYEQYKRSVDDKERMIIDWGELIKSATTRAISRAFITGAVSQALCSSMSGMDMVWNSTFDPHVGALFGFTREDVRRGLQTAQPALTQTQQLEHLERIQRYYGGYRFHRDQQDAVFDPQSVLYYLGHLEQTAQPPSDLDPALLRDNHEAAHFLINNHATDGPYTLQNFVLGHAAPKEMKSFEFHADPFFRSWELFLDQSTMCDQLVPLAYYQGFLTHMYSGDRRCTLTSPNLSTQTVLLRNLFSALPSAQMSQLEAWLHSAKPDVQEFERMVKLAIEEGSKETGRDLVSELGPKLSQVTGPV